MYLGVRNKHKLTPRKGCITPGNLGVTRSRIKWEMDTEPCSPRPGGHGFSIKLVRVLHALNFFLFGASLFAPLSWNYLIWVVSVLVGLAFEWCRPAGN